MIQQLSRLRGIGASFGKAATEQKRASKCVCQRLKLVSLMLIRELSWPTNHWLKQSCRQPIRSALNVRQELAVILCKRHRIFCRAAAQPTCAEVFSPYSTSPTPSHNVCSKNSKINLSTLSLNYCSSCGGVVVCPRESSGARPGLIHTYKYILIENHIHTHTYSQL